MYSKLGIFSQTNYVRHVNALNCTMYTFIGSLHAQFCIAGLQDSSAEEPKMHQNSRETYSSPAKPLIVGDGTVSPLSKNPWPWLSPLGFKFRSFGPRLAPTMLISFWRHCNIVKVSVVCSCCVGWSWWITVCLLAFIAVLIRLQQQMKLHPTSDSQQTHLMLQPVFLPLNAAAVRLSFFYIICCTFQCLMTVVSTSSVVPTVEATEAVASVKIYTT